MDKNKKGSTNQGEVTSGSTTPGQSKGVEVTPKPAYRYFCDSCTGVAFYLGKGDELPKSAHCASCGAGVSNIRKENLLKM